MSYQPLAQNDQSAYYPHNPNNTNPPPLAPTYAQPIQHVDPATATASAANPQYSIPAGYGYAAQQAPGQQYPYQSHSQPQSQPQAQPQYGYVAQGVPGAYQPLYQQPANVPQGFVAVPVNASMVQFQDRQGLAYNGLPLPQPGLWLDGLCDCFNDALSCLLAFFIPCIRQAMTFDKARLIQFWVAVIFFSIYYLCWISLESVSIGVYGSDNQVIWPGLIILGVALFFVFVRTYFRIKLREKYQISGSACEDCLMHCCCGCCAISQEARHVDRVEMTTPLRI